VSICALDILGRAYSLFPYIVIQRISI